MSIHLIQSGVSYDSNIYLVVAERTMLVDAGTGLGHDRVVSEVRRILGDRRLDLIVATHCHYDHVGGLKALADEFGSQVMAGEMDSRTIREADRELVLGDLFESEMAPVPDVSDLGDGDVVDLGGTRFHVMHTPGHTRGSICLYDAESKSLISGDTLFENGIGRTDFPGGSFTDLRNSLVRISNVDIRELYPGHGIICRNYGPAYMNRILTLVGV